MSRTVEEWIGKTPDSKIPDRVRKRVFERAGGKCHISGRIIRPGADAWDCDHIIALINGGGNRENNLAPALRDKHREKTSLDVALKAKDARVSKKHLGLRKKRTIGGRKFNGDPILPRWVSA